MPKFNIQTASDSTTLDADDVFVFGDRGGITFKLIKAADFQNAIINYLPDIGKTTDADDLIEGTLADARLSSNVLKKGNYVPTTLTPVTNAEPGSFHQAAQAISITGDSNRLLPVRIAKGAGTAALNLEIRQYADNLNTPGFTKTLTPGDAVQVFAHAGIEYGTTYTINVYVADQAPLTWSITTRIENPVDRSLYTIWFDPETNAFANEDSSPATDGQTIRSWWANANIVSRMQQSSGKPTLVVESGKKYVSFNGTQKAVVASTPFFLKPDYRPPPYTAARIATPYLAVLVRLDSGGNNERIISHTAGTVDDASDISSLCIVRNSSDANKLTLFNGFFGEIVSTQTLTVGTFYVVEFYSTGTQCICVVDGVEIASVNTAFNGIDMLFTDMAMGGRIIDDIARFNGRIGGYVYKADSTAAYRLAVRTYLASRKP